jgi:hypothetical protein
MNTRILHLVIIGLFISALSYSQTTELPFFDDFEESITNDAIFQNWTTENLEGWHYWHMVTYQGLNGSQCMRFENTDIVQNDWFVSNSINCTGAENLKVNFSYFYHTNKVPPKLYYTNQYNGNASQSTWTELSYSFGENEYQWYSSEDFIIENPGDIIYFAFHYQAAANEGTYFLLDNFSVKEYIPITPFELVGNSEHFEFYTNISGEENFYVDIQNELEIQFLKYSSLWNRPGIENVFNEAEKIKIYYSEKSDIDKVMTETPNWKSGFHDADKMELYLSPISNTDQESYYTDLQNLAKNEFSQLAISKKLMRENNNYLPSYFLEGFGLYEMGVRPRRDSIIKYMNENPVPDFNFLKDTANISTTLKKDLILSNIEGQILTPNAYFRVNPGYCCSYTQAQWPNYLKYFYQYPEQDRIKLYHESSHFNFYLAESDSNHFLEYLTYFEDAYIFFTENYSYIPEHRFNVVIMPTEQIGMDLTGYSRFNGGAGCGGDLNLMLSPNYNFDQETYDTFYAGMSAHEFFHIYYNHFMWEIPSGFWAEGSADFSARHSLGEDIRRERFWMIEWTFNEYAEKYNVELDLEHISSNPNLELDIYYLGDMFFEYLFQYHGGYEKIMEFFNKGMDYSVFNATYEEIDTGYINYLKTLAGIQLSVKDEQLKQAITIYPNPFSEILTIDSKVPLKKVEIFSMLGQKIKEINLGFKSISTISLSQGIYLVKIQSEKGIIVKKLIKK